MTIGPGEATISGVGNHWRVWYMIDRATETRWIKLGDSGAAVDCCRVRHAESAQPYITRETDSTCASAPAPGTVQT